MIGCAHTQPIITDRTLSNVSQPKPRILLIATGGTIAGSMKANTSHEYDPGKMTVEGILAAMPDVLARISLEGRQLRDSQAAGPKNPEGYVNLPSSFVHERNWIELSREINQALESEGFDGVVVTHGTDTLEETAFFLQLTVKSAKPVAVVGSMRPAQGSLDPDGPDNLRTAFRAIMDREGFGKGVFAVSNFTIFPAFDVIKVRSYPPDLPVKSDDLPNPFEAANFGVVARVKKTSGTFDTWPIHWNLDNKLFLSDSRALKIKFELGNHQALPLVPIIYQQIGNDSVSLLRDYYFKKRPDVRAFVFAGTGTCSLTDDLAKLVASQIKNDRVFIRSTRLPESSCKFHVDDYYPNSIGAATLSPQRAKILVQLLQLESGLGEYRVSSRQTTDLANKVDRFFIENVPNPSNSK